MRVRGYVSLFLSLFIVAVFTYTAVAQTTTATIRGKVTDESGGGVAGAEINAVSTDTGFVHTVTSRNDGSFLLAGLTPGSYNIVVSSPVVSSPAYDPKSQDLTVLVGQTIDLNLSMAPAGRLSEEITVIGNEVGVEMEATEVATQVTREQIENLPQNNRNFMNFAALAPGVTVSDQEFRKTFQAGAQSANAVNVFVDGVSFKNDVIQGGVVGQDASRGNPFPQNSVQEFRVLTQNYSAEFQKASSAVITAVTKSGTNDLDGEVFAFFQDNDLVDDHPITGVGQRFFERLQTGLSIGGPILRDRMHYFVGYEGNDQDRSEIVTLGPLGPPELRQQLLQYQGTFPSEFEEKLFFGKITFQPASAHLLDLSGFWRDESDVRSFGGRDSFERAEQVNNDVWQLALRHQFAANTWLNEASVSSQDYNWNPKPFNDLVGRRYNDIINIGGFPTEQDISQQRLSLRDDLTLSGFEWQGRHVFKVGAVVDQSDYQIIKYENGTPTFIFRREENWEFPFEAVWGLGDPEIEADNTGIGLYVQDEWSLTDRLLLNLGIRWDYESDMFPTDYVTPLDIRQKFASFVDPDQYFTDGDDRSAIDDMFAPRFGFSYDMFANSRTVVFGGWGRYYDRTLFNDSLNEKFRQQFNRGVFRFSRDGQPRGGQATVAWQERYLSREGLLELLATGQTGRPEVFLIENDIEAPYADQWTLGLRHSFGPVVGSVSYASTRSYNGLTFGWGHRNPDGSCCRWGEVNALGYAALITSQDDKKTWYDAVYLTLEKPFTSRARWGGQLAYTFSQNAEGIGGDLFSFDFPTVADYPRRPLNDIQDHLLVANGLVRLPLNFMAGTVVSYGSGLRYNIIDRSRGSGVNERILRGEGKGSAYLTIDLRLEYNLRIGGYGIGLIGEAFNVTNDERESDWERTIFTLPDVNPRFGEPTNIVAGSQRRFQYGVRFRF